MSGPLEGRHIVLGVSGSIASYKAAEVASRLMQEGAIVDVALTRSAMEFITPATFRALTHREPYTNMFAPYGEGEAHVELARRADALLIAPASATTLARLAHGLADDFLALTALATTAPTLVAPAMDAQMWDHAATQANRATLIERGVEFIGPASGRLASGRVGAGRLVDPALIVDALKARLGKEHGDLKGARVVITAGGTREAIDPVRYVSNHSSGKQGYGLAEAARDRGADVTLISTASLPDPGGVKVVRVDSALEMLEAVQNAMQQANVLIMAAAVADYRPAEAAEQKIKRADMGGELLIPLVENPDISKEVSGEFVKVVFAAETQNLIENAGKKLVAKGAALIIANDVSASDAGFAVDTNRVVILDAKGGREDLPLMLKYDVSMRILDRVAALL
ncbi:MAG: bifunctional phosphopantothenoylcysteine decarboxylase/phosphopantothenate--cysteine ligase CoaBC [Dehalococcoidia bacterium]|nr:bifunctional phosphopantothenoylcysteine decarboxylase/phosphopantothenate--cysteine ligase CoaBC [Dehalococcoidia bacterium]